MSTTYKRLTVRQYIEHKLRDNEPMPQVVHDAMALYPISRYDAIVLTCEVANNVLPKSVEAVIAEREASATE